MYPEHIHLELSVFILSLNFFEIVSDFSERYVVIEESILHFALSSELPNGYKYLLSMNIGSLQLDFVNIFSSLNPEAKLSTSVQKFPSIIGLFSSLLASLLYKREVSFICI